MKKFKLPFCLLASLEFFTSFNAYADTEEIAPEEMSESSISLSLFDNFNKKLKKSSFVNRDINPGVGWKIVDISYSPIAESEKVFKGRQLPWGKIKVTAKWINQDEGEYKNTCLIASGALDKEFSRWRYLGSFSCSEKGEKINNKNSNESYTSSSTIKGVSSDYGATLDAWIRTHIVYPDDAVRQELEGATLVHMRLDRKGHIQQVFVKIPSGVASLDLATVSIFQGQKLPDVPEDMKGDHFDIEVQVNYFLIRH